MKAVVKVKINKKLKKMRNEHSYTIYDMAKRLEISPAFYSQLENRRRRLCYDTAVKIATIFNLKPDEVFYDDYICDKMK